MGAEWLLRVDRRALIQVGRMAANGASFPSLLAPAEVG